MGLVLLITTCLMFSTTALAEVTYEYSECVYNVYKVACLGNKVRRMNLINCNLRQFPHLSNNENCVMLKHNEIEQFPDSFDNIKQLVTLDLSENRLESLPDNLDSLTNLEIMDVSKNRLKSLSPRTRFPVSLRGLLLAGNGLTTIPSGFKVPGLFVLDLSDNQFTEIPPNFCVSDQLIRVDITGNGLREDLSANVDMLNECRNVNEIPFCVYTDYQDYKCECESLAPVLLRQPSFCMGAKRQNWGMTCNAKSRLEQFRNETIRDVDKRLDFIRDECSYTLLSMSVGARVRADNTIALITSLCMLVTIYTAKTLTE